jgi:hypothetical protein
MALRPWLNTAVFLLLAGGVSAAQTRSLPPQNSTGTVTSASADTGLPKLSTPEGAVVITVNVCDPPTAGACQTQLTREQFERRFRTVYAGPRHPDMRPPNARAVADQYVQMFAYSYEAKKEGLDKDPQFQQQLQEVEMQLLADALQKKLKDETANPPEQVVQAYYNKIIQQYQEITVRSVLIPRPPRSKAAAQTAEIAEGSAPWPEGEDVETQKIADEARRQLIAGEDPDKVQRAAYAAAKCTEPLPSTQPVVWRRNVNFPAPEEAVLFALKPREVSLPVPNGHGLTIYRLESKRTIPLAGVKGEVKALYQMEQVHERLNSFLENAHPVLNEQYFKTEEEAELKAREMERRQEEGREQQ